MTDNKEMRVFMSTIREFDNAQVGATATVPNWSIAFKTGRPKGEWSIYDHHGNYLYDLRSEQMVGCTLNPTAPTNSLEAMDMAWDLAHEVKEGQVLPEGTRYVRRSQYWGLVPLTAVGDWTPDPHLRDGVRTLDPLPDPKPDWLDAPAVVAYVKGRVGDPHVFSRGNKTGTQSLHEGYWRSSLTGLLHHWSDLTGVVPLYPREGNEGMNITGPVNIQLKDRNGQTVWEI